MLVVIEVGRKSEYCRPFSTLRDHWNLNTWRLLQFAFVRFKIDFLKVFNLPEAEWF